MPDQIQGFIEKTRLARHPVQLKTLFMQAIADEGYENAVLASTVNKQLDYISWDEFPRGYLDAYRAQRWDKIDPVLAHIQVARKPFRWSDVVGRTKLTRPQLRFLHECRELGVHSGITVPLHGPGSRVDLVSLSLRHQHDIPEERLPYLYAMTVQFWLRQNELTPPPEVSDADIPHLTAQELECLRWCKEGKTNWEIGALFGVSEKTVEWHLTNVMKKLNANNRIMAVVIALQKGLIPL